MSDGNEPTSSQPIIGKRDILQKLLSNKEYLKILPYVSLMFYGIIMPQLIIPAYGAKWMAKCSNNDNDDCEYDYVSFNFYNSIFVSCRGILAFVFSAFIGMLSDSFGRKPMLYAQVTLAIVTPLLMIFNAGLWVYWAGSTVYGIFSGGQAISPITYAYISDTTHQNVKTMAFGIAIAVMGFVSILSAISATAFSIIWNDTAVWTAAAIARILTLFYIIFVLNESLPVSNRKELKCSNIKYINPLKPLYHVNDNPLIFWISVIVFLESTPSSNQIQLVYFSDQMNINNEQESNTINTIHAVANAISAMICAGMLLPFLKKRFQLFSQSAIGNLNLMIVGICGNLLSQCCFSLIPYFSDSYSVCLALIVFGSVSNGLAVFFDASVRGILTNYVSNEQHGIALGIIQSVISLTIVYGPFAFGYSYNLSRDELGLPSFIFWIYSVMVLLSLLITVYPLRRLLHKLEGTETIYSFKYEDEKQLLSMADLREADMSQVGGYDAMTTPMSNDKSCREII